MITYTSILVCPETGKELSQKGYYYNFDVCEECGHDNDSSLCHVRKEVGYWLYHPSRSWYEFWIKPKWVKKSA